MSEKTFPVIEEQLVVEKDVVKRDSVHIDKDVESREVEIQETLRKTTVDVQRRRVERVLQPGEEVEVRRNEEGQLVVPVVEERLVLRKERVLREEVIISENVEKKRYREKATLRRERVDVKRTSGHSSNS